MTDSNPFRVGDIVDCRMTVHSIEGRIVRAAAILEHSPGLTSGWGCVAAPFSMFTLIEHGPPRVGDTVARPGCGDIGVVVKAIVGESAWVGNEHFDVVCRLADLSVVD